MLNNYNMKISYFTDSKQYASCKEKTGHYIVDIVSDENGIKCILKPTVTMDNIKFTLNYDYIFGDSTAVFPNGYQSWTDSREFTKSDVMPPLTKFCTACEPFIHANSFGDYTFTTYTKEKGIFHGFSYGYIRNDNDFELIGSLNEATGYTILYFDMKNNNIIIQKELEGLTLEAGSEYEIMSLYYTKGGYDEVFDKYFATLNIAPCGKKSVTGYTSWYNYYTNINEEIINRDLDALSALDNKLDIFQIDDGYQTTVGDWLDIDPVKFPNGIKAIADKIHSVGMKAGLWLAPFVTTAKSKIFSEHPDWYVKNAKGNPLNSGMNWGGHYALDLYNEEVRAYLKTVFDTVLRDWGFDMVKLDFLYAACIVPYNGKTRGELMTDAVDLLRELVGDDKAILGCGVPLFPCFGKFDYCRIGCDVSEVWAPKPYFYHYHREDVSTENTLKSTIFRRHLDGRAFVNDPDVIILRDIPKTLAGKGKKASSKVLNFDQQQILALINKVAGNILFVSDTITEYDDDRKTVFNKYLTDKPAKVIDAKYIAPDVVSVDYEFDGVTDNITFNIKKGFVVNPTPTSATTNTPENN